MKNLYILALLLALVAGCSHKVIKPTSISGDQKQKAHDHFTNGMFQQLDGQNEKALIEYYQALLYDSSSSEIYNRIAENHIALGRFETALQYLKRALPLAEDKLETYKLMADSYYRLKDDEQAAKYLEIVLKENPLDDNARNLLILLYRKNSNYLGLADQYKQLIKIYGEDEGLVRKASAIFIQNGKFDEAITIYKLHMQSDSTNAGMWYNLGMIYEMKEDQSEAVKSYLKALRLSPKFEDAAERIHIIYRQNGQWKKMVDTFEPLHAKDPEFLVPRLALAEAWLYLKEFDKSRNLLASLVGKSDMPWQVYEMLGRLEMESENLPLAEKYFKSVIDIDGNNRIGWLFLGFVYADMDSLNKAEENYRHALLRLPKDPYLLSYYGITLGRLGRDEEALKPLQEAVTIDPQNLTALLPYGLALNRLGRFQDAISPLEQALAVDEKNLTAISTLGIIYDQLKLYEKSDPLYEKSLKFFPENDLLLNNYSYSLSERGIRLEYALQLAETAVKLQPENGAYLDTIGWIHFKLGNFEQAREFVEKSLDTRENSATVIEHLGDIYHSLGNSSKAHFYWQKALELDSGNILLKKKLEQDKI